MLSTGNRLFWSVQFVMLLGEGVNKLGAAQISFDASLIIELQQKMRLFQKLFC